MTIDEAIAREKYRSDRMIEHSQLHCVTQEFFADIEYHKQLAEWLEELKELKEKNTEKKVKVWANGEEHCPCCDKNLSSLGFFKHCIDCGQKLDWSE